MHCLLVVYIAILICFQYCCSCNFTEMRKNGNKWQSSLWLPLWVRFAFAEGLYERIWLHCCSYILQDAWRDLGFRTSKDFSLKLTAASLNCDAFLVFGQNMSEYTCCMEQTNSFMLAPSFALVWIMHSLKPAGPAKTNWHWESSGTNHGGPYRSMEWRWYEIRDFLPSS